jgi:hypothetical protein
MLDEAGQAYNSVVEEPAAWWVNQIEDGTESSSASLRE